jgi:hypothetical protein
MQKRAIGVLRGLGTRLGRREAGGGPGQIFFRGPYLKKFSGKNFFRRKPPPVDNFLGNKNFPDEYVAITFQGLYLNFSCQISVLSPKKTDILSFARKYLTHKKDWGPTKNFQGPPAPRGPGQFAPPLSAALVSKLRCKWKFYWSHTHVVMFVCPASPYNVGFDNWHAFHKALT